MRPVTMEYLHPADLKDQKVLVLGLGAFGGGAGCARALVSLGALVTVTDLRPVEALAEGVQALEGLPITFALGGHHQQLFEDADVVVVNPAVPSEAKWLQVAQDCGCKLTTEVNLAIAAAAHLPAVAITGTNGKSTCAALTAHLLEGMPGTTVLSGNLGGSLLEAVLPLQQGDRLVIELSSFQTERLVAPKGWPQVVVLTHLGTDHLDRHHTVPQYWRAKRRLLEYQDEHGHLLLPVDCENATEWQKEAHGTALQLIAEALPDFGLTTADLPFSEPYRLPSLLAALHAARLLGMEDELIRQRTRSFPGLPYRMARFQDPHGRNIIDNAVATHPDPTAAALKDLQGEIVLLAGGKDKGLDLSELIEACARCTRLYFYGEGGARLAKECQAAGLPSTWTEHFKDSATKALQSLGNREFLLFSPTFSSYDEFRNFRDRAELFHSLCAGVCVGKEETGRTTAATENR
ncbi:MAG: UDP-N-acetylmuramoyl-L-alanine--D-glutamate ligase [Planctomycetes bacterium]|nr:UDP-N-acetylmuramoyl-L-alanine--D-glutamate ligase [Planctomycetota bacterium]MCP4771354.1 UDP-N-acetylmuramoyl-L-alanine--D-glutamate ligase [Planctomycetota bacterium]MCP4861791.1 UDP-N-acetylmuramoyl-L-alanine--D-glutamate ligase [Planctomycetota bacterium]